MSLEIIKDNSELVVRDIASAISRALEAIGLQAEGDVKGYITEHYIKDTGRLGNSITHVVNEGEKAVYVGTNVEYALYVHMGHDQQVGRYVPAIGKKLVKPHVDGRPFLTEPLSKNVADYRDIAEEEFKK